MTTRRTDPLSLAQRQHRERMQRDQELLAELVTLFAPVERAARRAVWALMSGMPDEAGVGYLDEAGRLRRASADVVEAMGAFTEQAALIIEEAIIAESVIAVADAAALAAE